MRCSVSYGRGFCSGLMLSNSMDYYFYNGEGTKNGKDHAICGIVEGKTPRKAWDILSTILTKAYEKDWIVTDMHKL